MRKQRSSSPIQPLTWLISGVVAVVFIGVIVVAALQQDVLRSKDIEPILIVAPDTPVKRRPAEATGLQFPHQERKVFNLLEGHAPATPEPVTPAIQIVDEQLQPITEEKPRQPENEVAALVAELEQAPPPPPTPKPAVRVEPAPAVTGGDYGVQLAAFVTRADAERAAKQYHQRFDVLQNMEQVIQTATVNGRTVYRVRFKGVANNAAARKLCEQIKAQGQGCLNVSFK